MPRIHPRESDTDLAEYEIRAAINTVLDAHDLTTWETVRVVSSACNSVLQGEARMGIRMERHGNYDKEGGLQ
jgi:hypothetical protein